VKQNISKISVNSEVLDQTREIYRKNRVDLERYIDFLLEWNEKINLVSRNVSRETVQEHVVHSLLPITLGLLDEHQEWLDSGTGGGLPGIPIAICEPGKFLFLNDNVRKKMRAVGDIVSSLGLENVRTVTKSISLVELKKGAGIMTKHAFKIPDLLRLLGKKPWQTILMWKGSEDAEEEVKNSRIKLNCKICEFDFGGDEPFYEGKSLVLVERKN